MEWIAAHSDGWVTYPRPLAKQSDMIALWKRLVDDHAPDQFKPFVQSLYIDLVDHMLRPSRSIFVFAWAGAPC